MQIFNSITTLYRLAKRPRNRQWNTAICMNNFLRLSKTSCQLRRNELRIKLLSSRKISHRFSSQQLRQTQVSRLYLNLLSVFASSQGRVELKTKVLGYFLFFLAIPLLLFSRCFFFHRNNNLSRFAGDWSFHAKIVYPLPQREKHSAVSLRQLGRAILTSRK